MENHKFWSEVHVEYRFQGLGCTPPTKTLGAPPPNSLLKSLHKIKMKASDFFNGIFGLEAVIPVVVLFTQMTFSEIYLIARSSIKCKIAREVCLL